MRLFGWGVADTVGISRYIWKLNFIFKSLLTHEEQTRLQAFHIPFRKIIVPTPLPFRDQTLLATRPTLGVDCKEHLGELSVLGFLLGRGEVRCWRAE